MAVAVLLAIGLALAGMAGRDTRTGVVGAALAVAGGLSLPAGALLLAASGQPVLGEPRRLRPLTVALAAGLFVAIALMAVVLEAPDALPQPGREGPLALLARGVGMAGFALAGVRAWRVWRLSGRRGDLAITLGLVTLAWSQTAGDVVSWRDPGAFAHVLAAAGILLVGVPAGLDLRVTGPGAGSAVADAERDLGAQLRGLLAAAAARDPLTAAHSRRVAALGADAADRMGLSPRVQRQAAAAGLLHHLGALRGDEHTHPLAGEALLRQLGGVPLPVRDAVRGQHERLDGTGSPDGLRGQAVRVVTRVVAVCDAYDTRVAAGEDPEQAVAALRELAGDALCPAALEALEASLQSGLHLVDADPEPAVPALPRLRLRPRPAAVRSGLLQPAAADDTDAPVQPPEAG